MDEQVPTHHAERTLSPRGDWLDVEAIYRAHVKAIWRFAFQRLHGDRDGADEVTSAVFLAMVQQADRFDPQRASVESWLFAIARNKLADHLRKLYRDRAWRERYQQRRPTSFTLTDASVDAQQQGLIRETLEAMPGKERDALIWKYCDQMSMRRMAARLGRSEKACENLLYRARNRFREHFTRITKGLGHELRS